MIAITIENAALESGISASALLYAIKSGDLVAVPNEEVDGGYITTQSHLARYLNHSLEEYLALLGANNNSPKPKAAETASIGCLNQINIQHDSISQPKAVNNPDQTESSQELAITKLTNYLTIRRRSERTSVINQYCDKISTSFKDETPDYLSQFSLRPTKVGRNRKNYSLDLRKTAFKTIRDSLFHGQKRPKIPEPLTAKHSVNKAANLFIHEKMIEAGRVSMSDTSISPFENIILSVQKRINNDLAQGETQNDRATERSRLLAVWAYIFDGLLPEQFDQEFIDDLTSVLCEHLAKSTVNDYLIELRAICKRVDKMTSNPEVFEVKSFQSSAREFKDIPLNKLMKFLVSYTDHPIEKLGIELGYWTGMRFTNLFKDITEGCIVWRDFSQKISRQNYTAIHIKGFRHKNRRKVEYALSEEAERCLKKLLLERKRLGIRNANLLALDNSGKIFTRDIKRWKEALSTAYLDDDIIFHHFRHYRATAMLDAGFDFEDVRIALGLASTKMVEMFYGHRKQTQRSIDAVTSSASFDKKRAKANLSSQFFPRTEVPDSQCSTKSRTLNTGSVSLNLATAANEFASTAVPKKQQRKKLNK